MGNCCGAPARQKSPKKSPKPKKGKKPNPFSVEYSRGPAHAPQLIVLKDATGRDIGSRYDLGQELGRGEFGVTYLCTDRTTGDTFACKSISKNKLRTAVDIEDVRREVDIMRLLPKHPNIVTLKDTYEDDNAVHLVMELCEGGELFDRIVARGHYTERAAAVVTRTIVEVVQMCHKHGVMHRDLKPENFLFANKKETAALKAIDFGLSVTFRPGERFTEIVGSPYYMAPEVLKRYYGPEIDVWSAGVILYILLCGVPPFWAETEQGVAQAIIRSVIDFKRDPWPIVSDNAKDLVKRMLDPDPKRRLTAEGVLDHPWLQNVKKAPDVPLGETVRARLQQFSVMNKLKKKALRVVAEYLSIEEVAGIKEMFQKIDIRSSGQITLEELKVGLHKLGYQVPDADVQILMEAADIDGNGVLDYGEFVAVSVHLRKIGDDEHLHKAFAYFDQNKSGYIEIEELKDSLADDLGPNQEEVVNAIIRDVDTDKDGKISYEEFATMMKAGALVSGIHLLQTNPEIVKRWGNEVQEAVQSRSALVQFHGLALLHQIRQNDRLAVSKLVTSLTKGSVRSPLAQCLLIRYTSQVIREASSNSQTGDRPFYDFLESCLRHKAEMVIFEAARAITELSGVTSRELTPAITVLQLFLSSSKPVLRFAAVRTLNKVAMTHPLAVTNCNIDMESLISDQNRSIATLAITTLLKTGNEVSVDRLMKQITNFMSDIADEFKIVVVEAIRSLCLKFPLKYRALMNFLSNILREEGGFDYKKAIVDSIVILIRDIPDAKESGLFHLCEFIEDCEFTYLSTQILHFLGNEGPKTSDPSKYIRYIYNRVILENPTVRASAVSTLAKFGAMVDSLKPRIFVLLRRCLFDSDDEVRDRATLYLNTLGVDGTIGETDEDAKELLFGSLDVPLVNLETSLKNYEPSEEPFDILSVPRELKSQPLAEKKAPGKKPTGLGAPVSGPTSAIDSYERLLSSIPEFAGFGRLFKSSPPIELTEAETEYAVNVVKHIYDSHVVFQYNCTNTIPEQLLENVTVFVDASEAEEFIEIASKPLRALPYDSPGQTFVAFEKPDGAPAVGKFSNLLKFIVKDVDPSTEEADDEGVEDEYQLEEVEVVASDYMLKVGVSNFRNAWESLGPDCERVDEYGLGVRESLAEAVAAVTNILGMQPCEGTDVVPTNSRSHTCLLSGVFIGNVKVLVRLSFGIDGPKQVAMKLAVRSEDQAISDAIHDIVANG